VKKKILLIDGNSFCYRAFYAIRSLTTSAGEPTNAVYGFVTILNKLRATHKPDYLAVAFDLKGPTFRHQRFADYKAHRKPMPDELSVQLPTIRKVLSAYRISVFEKKGYEADDVLATLAKKLSGRDLEIFIVTGDKDILQLVDSTVKVINPHKSNGILNETWVRQRYGVEPKKIVEIMALAGDASDNIPGVPGIGEATAMDLIKKYGTLDEVMANLDNITKKALASRIKQFSQQAQMSRELAQLDHAVPQLIQEDVSGLLEKLKITEGDKQDLFKIFKELEFKSLMQTVAGEFTGKRNCRVVSAVDEAEKHLKKISKSDSVAIYLETDRDSLPQQKIVSVAFACDQNENICFPVPKVSLDKLRPVLENGRIKKIGHNLKQAKLLLANHGIDLEGISFDSMIAAYLLNPARLRYELSDLSLEYLNCNSEETKDPSMIFRISKILKPQLKEKNLLKLFEEIEMPLVAVLAAMEKEGVVLDKNLMLRLGRDFDRKLKTLTQEIYEMAGEEFNVNSPKQLSVVLFEKLKLPKIKRTKTGLSTNTEVLNKLSAHHPIAQSLLEYRAISKLKSTYIDGLIKLLGPKSNKIHTSFNQTGTATGRLSSSGPNLQNIPIKTELGRSIRKIFIPANQEQLFLSADYSQIELRILAHLSGDEALVSAFKQDLDIHSFTASLIFGEADDKITRQMRNAAKTVNFGIIYGMSAYGLSKDLGIQQDRAQDFIDAYFKRYPGVQDYISSQTEKAKRLGFVTTLMERRRYVPEINSTNEHTYQFAQRVAINAPVQGTASDLIKAAMIEIHCQLKANQSSTKMIIQVHDELVFSVPKNELEAVKTLIKAKMENVIKLKVPIKTSLKCGKNWLEMN